MSQREYEPKFKVENLGTVREGEFTQKPLTIFCGPNNSGKTWAMYSLYHYSQMLDTVSGRRHIKFLRNIRNSSVRSGQSINLDRMNWFVNSELVDFFNTKEKILDGAKIDLMCTEKQLQSLLDKKRETKNVFLMPAERNGLHLFFRELSNRRTALLHHVSKGKINVRELLRDVMHSRYAKPIADYIDWLNEMPDTMRKGDKNFHDHAEKLKSKIVRGVYNVDKRTGDITFKPRQTKRDGRGTQSMSIHMASSTAKSLFGLWFYLEYQATEGDLLMIDEPELNIHPENQLEVARLLARLVNAGLRVVISTHSDYIVREFNSLIMLHQQGAEDLVKQYRYEAEEVLDPEKVGAYLFDDQTISPLEIFKEDGIYATTFDKVIAKQEKSNDDIYYTMQERRDEQ